MNISSGRFNEDRLDVTLSEIAMLRPQCANIAAKNNDKSFCRNKPSWRGAATCPSREMAGQT